MANIKSAKKRAKTNAKRKIINFRRKSEIKTLVKKFKSAIENKNIETAKDLFKLTESKISRAAGKGLFKKNAASRKISRLNKRLANI